VLSSVDELLLRDKGLFVRSSSSSSSSDDDEANSPEIFFPARPLYLRLISIGLGLSRSVRRTGLGGSFGDSSFESVDPKDLHGATDAFDAWEGSTDGIPAGDSGTGFGGQ
jgi:hypothetical protein